MKPEPLTKEKIFDMLGVYIFTLKDVKSAVEWLLKEIEERAKHGKKIEDYYIHWKEVVKLIKKAFSGVLRE